VNDIDITTPETMPVGLDETPADDTAQRLLTTVRDVTSEIIRVVQETAAQATDGWSLPAIARAVVPELEEAYRERDALRQEVDALQAERLSLEARLTESGRARVAIEATLTDARRRIDSLEAEASAAGAREQRLHEQLDAVTRRAESERDEAMRLARDMTDSAESARAALASELDATRETLASERASLAALQDARSHAESGATECQQALARAQETIAALESARESTAAEIAGLRAKQTDLEGVLAGGQQEQRDVQTKLRELATTHEDVLKDRVRLRQELDAATAREQRAAQQIQELQAALVPTGATVDAALLERAREHERALETELASASATARAATARLELLQSELATAVDASARYERDVQAAREERTRLVGEIAALTARAQELERERDEARDAAAATVVTPVVDEELSVESVDSLDTNDIATFETFDDPVEEAPIEAAAPAEPVDETIEPLATLETFAVSESNVEVDEPLVAAEPTVEIESSLTIDEPELAAAPTPTIGHLAVLDTRAWDAPGDVTLDAVPVGAEIDPDAPEDVLPEITAERCLMNLASPDAIALAARLRDAGTTTPFWACAIASDAIVGVSLGSYEVLPRPLEPERVHQQLANRVPAGATVVVVRSDGATLLAIRQGLLQSGHSVRTAWTLAQAAELTASLRAAVVVVDLAQEPARAAELCLELARRSTPPMVVLLPGTDTQTQEFAAALGTLAGAEGTLDRAGLVAAARV
jgi:uncharacterized coiled-coil DUF342 family protein/CheY-like chemotaxis protein